MGERGVLQPTCTSTKKKCTKRKNFILRCDCDCDCDSPDGTVLYGNEISSKLKQAMKFHKLQ